MANDKPQFYRYRNSTNVNTFEPSYSPEEKKPSQEKDTKKRFQWLRPFMFVVTEIAVIIGVIAIYFERRDATVNRINTAWQIVINKAPGNSGKRQALEYLNSWQCYYLDNIPWFKLSTKEKPILFWEKVKNNVCLKKPVPLTGIDLSPKLENSQEQVIKEFNKNTPPPVGTHLNGVKLQNADLYKANLSQAILSKADLSGAILSKADLSGADLSGADLAKAILSGADLYRAYLLNADLSGANFYEANLSEIDLSGAYLTKTSLVKANLSRSNLYKANLTEAKLNDACLVNTNLYGADLTKTNLSGTDLTNADLTNADLRKAVFFNNPSPGTKEVCEQLKQANNWEKAYRDERYACGAPIPVPPDDE